uniref:WD_REPEATS_REGION domain-containing protein n=1 Tax=Echinostoma caproni TaxID=27848 RepID=A0A183AWZ5_9TREM
LNALVSHQTLSLAVGAHEDSCLRFYDIGRMSSERSMVGHSPCVETMVAHMDAITSLAVDAHGLYLITGGHDASVRVWDLESRACVQEITNHRAKHNEAVNSVALHPRLPLAASAGADGVCKVYVTST